MVDWDGTTFTGGGYDGPTEDSRDSSSDDDNDDDDSGSTRPDSSVPNNLSGGSSDDSDSSSSDSDDGTRPGSSVPNNLSGGSSSSDNDSTPEPTQEQEQMLDGSSGGSSSDSGGSSDPLSGGSDADLPDAPSVDRDNPFDDSDSSDSSIDSSSSSDDDSDSTPEPTQEQEQMLDGSSGGSSSDSGGSSDPLSGGSDADLPDAPSVDRDNPFDDSDSSDSSIDSSSSSDDDSDSTPEPTTNQEQLLDGSTDSSDTDLPEEPSLEQDTPFDDTGDDTTRQSGSGIGPAGVEGSEAAMPDAETDAPTNDSTEDIDATKTGDLEAVGDTDQELQTTIDGEEFQGTEREIAQRIEQEVVGSQVGDLSQSLKLTGAELREEDIQVTETESGNYRTTLSPVGRERVGNIAERQQQENVERQLERELNTSFTGEDVSVDSDGNVQVSQNVRSTAREQQRRAQTFQGTPNGPSRQRTSTEGREPREEIVRQFNERTDADLSESDIDFQERDGRITGTVNDQGQVKIARANAQFQGTPVQDLFAAGAATQERIEQRTDPAAERFDEITPDNFVREGLERITSPVATRFNEVTPTRGEAVSAAGDAARSAAQTNIPFTDIAFQEAGSLPGQVSDNATDAAIDASVPVRQRVYGVSEEQARENIEQDIDQAGEGTYDAFSPAVGRNPAGGINAVRGIAGITAIAGGIGAAQEIDVPEQTDESELDTPENEQRSEITVPEEETRVSPSEIGVPRESVQSGEIDIDGPEGTRITDEGDIVIPAGTTQVARGTREEAEEREDVVEEEAEEDAEEEEDDEVRVNVPEELLPDEEQTIGEEDTEVEEDDLTTEEEAQEQQEEDVNPIQFPEQRQGEQDADPEDTRSDESFGEQVVEQGQSATSESTGQGTTVGGGIFDTVEGSGATEATTPPILRDDQDQAEATQDAQAQPQTPDQAQNQAPAQADVVADITGQFNLQGQTPGLAQGPQFGTPQGFGEPTDSTFDTPTENPPEQRNPPRQGPTPTDPPNRPPNRLPDFDVGGDDDEEDLFGIGADNAPILTDFQNPLTGDRIETGENPADEGSFPGLDF